MPANSRWDLIRRLRVKQFLTDVNTVCFLVLSQHTGHKFCGDAMHVEFFCQNCLAWSKADAYIFSSLSDSQTANLENQMMNCIDANVVCWRGRLSTSGIFINRRSSCFETTVPLKTLCSAHTFVSEGLLKHFLRFSSSFPEFEAKFHTHALFFQVLHFHCLKNHKPVTALVYFSGCSSLTGSDRVMRQEALCYWWLPLLSTTSRSAFHSLV